MSEHLSINHENLRKLFDLANKTSEDARRAIEANGPKIAAGLESFAKALRRT